MEQVEVLHIIRPISHVVGK